MGAMGPKRGDLEPNLVVDVSDGGGADLSLVTSWRMIARLRGATVTLFIDTTPTSVVDPGDSSKVALTHLWVSGETSTAGVIEIECEATWPGGRKQTFPNAGYTTITIDQDLA